MVEMVGRRSQEERSAQMRERLLDATIECLVEFGYAGTTTPRVAAKAGVTRGAQVHHFPSKQDLVIAAIKHLAAKRTQSVLAELAALDPGADVSTLILDFLWEVHQGPLFLATVELWVAARTDSELAEAMADVEPYVNNALLEAIARAIPGTLAQREVRDFIYTAMDAIRGILVSNFPDPDPARARRRWQRACTHLRVVSDTTPFQIP